MSRQFFFLWPLWLLFVVQGCTPRVRDKATIKLEGERIKLRFSYRNIRGKRNPLKEIFKILETKNQIDPKTGKKIDLNQPRNLWMTPLEMAIDYALGNFYNDEGNEDTHFYAARYLLAHGADPNARRPPFGKHETTRKGTAMHRLCIHLFPKRDAGIRGLALFLSYGGRLDIKEDYMDRSPIDIIERAEPWITKELIEEHKEKEVPAAWKDKISPGEQARLKKEYFENVVGELLKLEQHKPLDPTFVRYVEGAGVKTCLEELQRRKEG